MLTRRSLLASLLALVPGFAWAGRTPAATGFPRDDGTMTFLGAQCLAPDPRDDRPMATFWLRCRLAMSGLVPRPPAEVLVVLRFRTDDGRPCIRFFTLATERITEAKALWLFDREGTVCSPSAIERRLRGV
ncbi:MAG: hypothetical protein ACREUU_08270 [Gammaproteobacteria bacterium]